ncbi:MAG: hypothetical protein ACPLRY_08350 [Candidatus Bathyarchaeales archaeon]
MKQNLTLKQRKEIKTKLAQALQENITCLTTELQKILIDDLTTAFQNRINVLIRAQEKSSY